MSIAQVFWFSAMILFGPPIILAALLLLMSWSEGRDYRRELRRRHR